MTQKRGLGRGLGALIPGGAAAPREEQELRTRSHPRTTPEAGEPGAAARPVDMFFSGDPVEAPEGERRTRAPRTDIASDMARSARARREATKSPARSAKKTAAPKAEKAEKAEGAPAAPTEASPAPAEPTPAPVVEKTVAQSPAAIGTTDDASQEAAEQPTKPARRRTAAAAPAAPFEAAPEAEESPSAVEDDAEGEADAAPAVAAETAAEPARRERSREDSPVVDVEHVVLTPAREEEAAMPVEAAPSAKAPAPQETDEAPEEEPSAEDASPRGEHDLMPVPGAEFAEIPIHEIRENPRNPRTMFDEEELDELAFSLREVGVLQPVVVRPISVTDAGESFELVMGERRWRAARRAGLAAIPAIIRETSDDDLLRDALLENLHRSQLNPLEEAAAYQQLLEDFGITQDQLAERIGRSRPQISNTLRLMRLPALVQRRLASGAISAGHARALLTMEDPKLQEELAQRIVAEGLSVRAVEALVSRGIEPAGTRTPPRRTTYNPRVVDITSRLSNQLEAPVKIDLGKRKGRITLEFTNLEDLERLASRLGIDLGTGQEGSAAE